MGFAMWDTLREADNLRLAKETCAELSAAPLQPRHEIEKHNGVLSDQHSRPLRNSCGQKSRAEIYGLLMEQPQLK